MLLRLIKSSNFFGIILIPITGLLFWMQGFQSPGNFSVVARESTMPLYFIVQTLFKGLVFWQILAGFILVILNALIIARISSSFLLYKKGSALPAIIYVITISSVKTLQTLHPVHIATLCILIAISYIFDTYQKREEIPSTFNASFFIAAASLFYLPAAILLPMIWISIFVLQKSDNWRLLVVPVLGFCVPWFFFWTVSFLNDTINNFLPIIKNILWSRNNAYLFDPVFLVKSALILLLIIFGSISFLTDYQSIKISARKYFTIFYWMFGIVLLTALFLVTIGNEFVGLIAIPATVIISYFFLAGGKYFWKELFFLVYIGVMLASCILYG
jgi:hypothetical protein